MISPLDSRLVRRAADLALIAVVCSQSKAQQFLWEWQGENPGFLAADDRYGCSVSLLGDVDGDGVVDAVVGAPTEDQVALIEIGCVRVMSGATGAILQKHWGPQQDDKFGLRVAGGGDVDGDGVGDFVVGSFFYDVSPDFDNGAAFVYSGFDGTCLWAWTGEHSGDNFGATVAMLGDLDGDGRSEVGVGAGDYDASSTIVQSGRIYVYSGGTGSLLYTITGQTTYQQLTIVTRLGDLNGDGIPELGVGSQGWGGGPNGEGQFDVCDGPTGAILYTLVGEVHGDAFAFGAGLGDLDADGIDDFLVGAPLHTTNPGSGSDSEGRVYVYSGATGTLMYQYDGAKKDEHFGSWNPVVGRLDFNHDGYDDILVGSPLRKIGPKAMGVAMIYSGRNGRLLYRFSRIDSLGIRGGYGAAQSAVGDMNGDGIDDVILGAPGVPTGTSTNAGRAFVVAGNDLLLQANAQDYYAGDPIWINVRGGEPGRLAMLVLTDVNGTGMFLPLATAPLDGYGELVISDTVPSGLSGLTLTFLAYAQKPVGRGIVDSLTETIVFQ